MSLVIAGLTIPVAEDGGSKGAPEVIGTSSRTFAGNLRSTKRVEKQPFTFRTLPILEAEAQAIEDAIALGAQVVCTGNFLGNKSGTTFEVERGDSPLEGGLSSDGRGYFRVLTLTLREV